MIGRLTRRSFIARAGALFGALSLPGLARARAQDTRLIFRLRPNGVTCHACVQHARNALFPSKKAANGNRAHVGCNCRIQRGRIDSVGWQLLFHPSLRTRYYKVDRRSRRVHLIIRQYPPTFPA